MEDLDQATAYDLQAHDPSVMDWRVQFRTDAEGRYWALPGDEVSRVGADPARLPAV